MLHQLIVIQLASLVQIQLSPLQIALDRNIRSLIHNKQPQIYHLTLMHVYKINFTSTTNYDKECIFQAHENSPYVKETSNRESAEASRFILNNPVSYRYGTLHQL